MPSINEIRIMGHAGDFPKTHVVGSGQMVANFSVATTEKWKDKQSGEWKEKTEWHRVVAWRFMAEAAEKYIKKGSLVYVEGKIETRRWEKDGVQRETKEIIASRVLCLDKREKGAAPDSAPDSGGGSQQQDEAPPPDEDLPF